MTRNRKLSGGFGRAIFPMIGGLHCFLLYVTKRVDLRDGRGASSTLLSLQKGREEEITQVKPTAQQFDSSNVEPGEPKTTASSSVGS
jgi:hypothetical protein